MTKIYALVCPFSGRIRYIGKADDPQKRLLSHLRDAQSGKTKYHHGRWLRQLLAGRTKPILETLFVVGEGMRWQDAERFFIASATALGFDLTNATRGGEGLALTDPDARARVIRSLKAAHARPEVIQRHLTARTDPVIRRKMSEAQKEINGRPGLREKKSAACKKTKSDPAARALASQQMKAINQNPEVRANKAATMREQWKDAELRKRRSEAISASWVRRRKGMEEYRT